MTKPESIDDDVYETIKSEQQDNPFSGTDAQYGVKALMRKKGFDTDSEDEMYELGIDMGKTVLHLSEGNYRTANRAFEAAKRNVENNPGNFDDPGWTLGEAYTVEDAVGALDEAEEDLANQAKDGNLEYDWGITVDQLEL